VEAFAVISQVTYSSVMKKDATYSSETSFGSQRTTRHFVSEDRTPLNYRCENLKPYIACLVTRGNAGVLTVEKYDFFSEISKKLTSIDCFP
jgi:hypothetical protein